MDKELNLEDLEEISGGNDGAERYTGNGNVDEHYVVQAGDTLGSIARKVGSAWRKIFEANKVVIIAEANKRGIVCSKVDDYANHIWPGTVLVIPR
jgi:nucleoid-associated protein YgaU